MSRPRGFAPWQPRSDAADLVDSVRTIIHDYHEQLPLTLRQVLYIAVTRALIGKTEKDYNRLTENDSASATGTDDTDGVVSR